MRRDTEEARRWGFKWFAMPKEEMVREEEEMESYVSDNMADCRG